MSTAPRSESMKMLMDTSGSWRAFWPTLPNGSKVVVFWHQIAAILPPEHPEAGTTLVLAGGRTIDVVETREQIERAVLSR